MAAPTRPNTFETFLGITACTLNQTGISKASANTSVQQIQLLTRGGADKVNDFFNGMCTHFGMDLQDVEATAENLRRLFNQYNVLKSLQATLLKVLDQLLSNEELAKTDSRISQTETCLQERKNQFFSIITNLLKSSSYYKDLTYNEQKACETMLHQNLEMIFNLE